MISTMRRQLRPMRFTRGVSQALAEPTAWNHAPVMVTTLPNGLRVATMETHSEVASTGIFIDAGVRNETTATVGATKIMEHLGLSGTKSRPKTKLELEVELMGAELSVSAGREQTSYTLAGGDPSRAVGILADLVTAPGISNFAKEKEAIVRSLEETEASYLTTLDDRLHSCAYRDCSLGLSTIGPFEGIHSITEAQLNAYHAANYTAERMVLAAAGPVKHADLVKMATNSLGSVKAGSAVAAERKPYFCGAELIYRNDEMGPTAYVSVGFESVPWRSADAVTFMVMQHIIGNYKKNQGLVPGTISGNRVINAIANKMGVGCAEEFHAFQTFYKDTGMFGFAAACDEVAVEHCIGELMFGINLLSFSVTEEEVARGKRELKQALFRDGSSAAACAKIGQQMLTLDRTVPAAEMMLRIDAIDAEEVKRVAWQYLNDAEVAVTAIGPLHGMPQYMDLRRATTMHRY